MSTPNIKYTNDGKKVLVVGKLNAQETIVQEIFISNDNEIPSGENFVVKSLHDAPAVSWKENDLKKLEERYERERKQYNSEIEKQYKSYVDTIGLLREKTSYLKKVVKNISESSFDMVADFLAGDIKYVVEGDWNPEIFEFKDFRCDYDRQKLKLITLFGNDDGTLNFRLGSYSDGSGSSKEIHVFKTLEDAIDKLKEILLAKKDYSEDTIVKAKKYGIELDAEKVQAYKDRALAGMDNNIQGSITQQAKWEQEKIRIQTL